MERLVWPPLPADATPNERDIVVAGERTTREAWQSSVRARPGCEYEEFEGFYVHSYPLPTESLNEVRIFQSPSDPERVLEQAVTFFGPRAPRWRLVCPPEWGSLLEAHCYAAGLSPIAHEPAMVIMSGGWRPQPQLAGFAVRRVEDSPTLALFGKTFADANGLPDSDFWVSKGFLDEPGWDLLLGFLDGRPVATGVGFTSGGTTGVWGIATVPECRGRGLGSAITWAVIHGGEKWGAHATHLWATKMGFPVYQKMGFKHVENKVIWTFERPGKS